MLLVLLAKMSSFDAVGLLAFIVSVPVFVTTILINMFFICCMFSSQEGPENVLKPPLNVLLGSLIGCNLVLGIVCPFSVIQEAADMPIFPDWIYIVLAVAGLYALRSSFTASLGLNLFYYFKIVPARQPFLLWVKTHIKLFIYLILIFENILILFGFILNVLPGGCLLSSTVYLNSSSGFLNISAYVMITDGVCYYLIKTDFCLRCIYFLVGFGIMVASNTSTVVYLWRHVKRMEDSSSFSAPHYQKQKRVAILSIIQTLLFFIYSVGLITYEFQNFLHLYFGNQSSIYLSLLAFYCFGTSIILGVGQTKFRLHALDVWKNLGQAFSQSNLNVDDRNGHFNCCLNFCYRNTENTEMLSVAHI